MDKMPCPHCGEPVDGTAPERYCLGCYWQEGDPYNED